MRLGKRRIINTKVICGNHKQATAVYLEPNQTSTMELFRKNGGVKSASLCVAVEESA